MRNNKALRLVIIVATIICVVLGASLTAYAFSDDDAERDIDLSEILIPVVTPEPIPTPEPTPALEPQSLTPPGNLTLVDDLSGEQTNDKQFITVITKSGNYFYIIIDRVKDRENVHFLNLVDEADLMAILEKDKKAAPATPAPMEPKPEPTPEPKPEPKQNNTAGLLVMLVLVGVLGGGAYYYFKVLKPKQGIKKTSTSELDDFDFDGDEDDFDNEETGNEPDGMEYDGDEDDMPDFTLHDEPSDNTEPESEEKE